MPTNFLNRPLSHYLFSPSPSPLPLFTAILALNPSILHRLQILKPHLHPSTLFSTTSTTTKMSSSAPYRSRTPPRPPHSPTRHPPNPKKSSTQPPKAPSPNPTPPPVTIGDFGAQALITRSLKSAFPTDSIVGEEEAVILAL